MRHNVGSLFELLSPARTRPGEAMLARWLTAPSDAPEIQPRQTAVEELASALDSRERLALAGADVRASLDTDRLLDRAESAMPPHRALRAVIWLFTAATVVVISYPALTSVWGRCQRSWSYLP